MALSAADLQKRLEGAPDPFPSLGDGTPSKQSGSGSKDAPLNTNSEASFPSLAPSVATKAPAAAWSSGTVRRATPVLAPSYTDSFVLTGATVTAQHKDGKPKTLSDVVSYVQTKHKVKVEISSQVKTNQSTFTVKGESQKVVEAAKRHLIADLSPKVTIQVTAPTSAIGAIIGPKGATLKQIRDQTGVKIDIPSRDSLDAAKANGQGSSQATTRSPSPANPDEEPEEPTVSIKIEGSAALVHEAQGYIQAIIDQRNATTSQKVKDIPAFVFPFVLQRRADFLKAAEGGEVTLARDETLREITVSGDRAYVPRVVETIKSCISYFEGEISPVKISLPKRQHHLLIGPGADEIFAKSKCYVIVSPDSDDVQVYGRAKDLGGGLQAVMERANSQHTASVPIPGSNAQLLLQYLSKSSHLDQITSSHSQVSVHIPTTTSAAGPFTVDLSGLKKDVDLVQKELSVYLKSLNSATKAITIDPSTHQIIQVKAAKQIKQYQSDKNVIVMFPQESESSKVLLIHEGGSGAPDKEKQKVLGEVATELIDISKSLNNLKIEDLTIEKKWHSAIKGRNNTTLNKILGEDKALIINFGPDDSIVVKGAANEVDKAVKDIQQAFEQAKIDEAERGHSIEFSISRDYVGRIVGSGGAAIQKYREQLDVKIDIEDVESKATDTKKKGKASSTGQSIIKVTGRPRDIAECKKQILSLVEKLEDETFETLSIPRQYHSGIIGQQGKYIQRLQEKYGVKIQIAKENSVRPDEVTLKGGKKGVAQAKAEILELVEFEKENNHTINFAVPSRAVSRILGQKGAKINEIMGETNAHIDVAKDEGGTTAVTVRGTKKAAAAAKAAILAIVDTVEEETTATVVIEQKYHRTIIGGGGVGLRNLLARVGGPTEPNQTARLVRFPQNSDKVEIRGEKQLVKKVQAELERVVAGLRERVVMGVVIPSQYHRILIGHGGQALTELEKRTGAEVQFPGSRSYHQVAAPINAEDLTDADEKNIVKVAGSQAVCEQAIKELQAAVAAVPQREQRPRKESGTPAGQVTDRIPIPYSHAHLLQANGDLVRELRSVGVNTSQNGKVATKPQANGATTARIDDDAPTEADEAHGVDIKILDNSSAFEDGSVELVLKARDAESLETGKKIVQESLAKAEKSTHIAYLTFPDRGAFPRIIGTKGRVVSDLCLQTDTSIYIPKDDLTITIHGAKDAVQDAIEAIKRVAFGGPKGGRRDRD